MTSYDLFIIYHFELGLDVCVNDEIIKVESRNTLVNIGNLLATLSIMRKASKTFPENEKSRPANLNSG